MIEGVNGSFNDYLAATIQEGKKTRTIRDIYDKDGRLKKESLMPILKEPREKWPTEIMTLVRIAPNIATAYEALGNTEAAHENYWLGSYAWTDPFTPFYSDQEDNIMTHRDRLVSLQLDSAICNDRISENNRARQLFNWVAHHRNVTDEGYEEWLRRWVGPRRYNDIWGRKIERVYALICLEQWKEAFIETKSVEKWMEKDPHPKGDHAWQYHYWLFQILKPLIEIKLGFYEDGGKALTKVFNPRILRSSNYPRSLFILFYLFALRAKFAGLARE